MLTIAIAVFVGLATGFGLALGDVLGYGWSSFCGVLAFGAVQMGLGMYMQKKVKAVMMSVQTVLTEGQRRLQAKAAHWQVRQPGSIKEVQNEMARDQRALVMEALAQTEPLKKFTLWVPLMGRQIATAQMQLRWMIKDFKAVDALMPKALFLDPLTVSMKLARMQMANAPLADMEKVYRKGVARLKYNQNVLLAATWSWILVKRGDVDGAFKALNAALKNSDNETLKANREHLANNRVAHFSNAGIGDQWYALHLEEPKIRMQRPRMQWR
jgi:hypothetical protein